MKTILELIEAVTGIFYNDMFLYTVNHDKEDVARRYGGYLCLRDANVDFPPYAVFSLGRIPNDKRERYYRNAMEKAERLFCGSNTLLSSWQTRDEAAGKYGGGIRTKELIFSFSGLPELADEAFMLLVARRLELLSEDLIAHIGNMSGSYSLYESLRTVLKM